MSEIESSVSALSADERAELEFLRGRVAELEREREEQLRLASRALAAAQERAYWLDRWHLDLNALMARPGAAEVRAAVRVLRGVVRVLRGVVRRVRLVKRRFLS